MTDTMTSQNIDLSSWDTLYKNQTKKLYRNHIYPVCNLIFYFRFSINFKSDTNCGTDLIPLIVLHNYLCPLMSYPCSTPHLSSYT